MQMATRFSLAIEPVPTKFSISVSQIFDCMKQTCERGVFHIWTERRFKIGNTEVFSLVSSIARNKSNRDFTGSSLERQEVQQESSSVEVYVTHDAYSRRCCHVRAGLSEDWVQ